MIGNVSGNDTGNVSGTCKHIISNPITLVNRNLVREVPHRRNSALVYTRRSRILLFHGRKCKAKVFRNVTEHEQGV